MTSIHLTRLDNRRATVKNQGSHKFVLARSLVFLFKKKKKKFSVFGFPVSMYRKKKKKGFSVPMP